MDRRRETKKWWEYDDITILEIDGGPNAILNTHSQLPTDYLEIPQDKRGVFIIMPERREKHKQEIKDYLARNLQDKHSDTMPSIKFYDWEASPGGDFSVLKIENGDAYAFYSIGRAASTNVFGSSGSAKVKPKARTDLMKEVTTIPRVSGKAMRLMVDGLPNQQMLQFAMEHLLSNGKTVKVRPRIRQISYGDTNRDFHVISLRGADNIDLLDEYFPHIGMDKDGQFPEAHREKISLGLDNSSIPDFRSCGELRSGLDALNWDADKNVLYADNKQDMGRALIFLCESGVLQWGEVMDRKAGRIVIDVDKLHQDGRYEQPITDRQRERIARHFDHLFMQKTYTQTVYTGGNLEWREEMKEPTPPGQLFNLEPEQPTTAGNDADDACSLRMEGQKRLTRPAKNSNAPGQRTFDFS